MFFVLAVVLLVVLPGPWNVIGAGVSFLLAFGEVAFWHRRVRHRTNVVGVETLIGATGIVSARCSPTGQVRIAGETWEAQCAAGAEVGDRVTVVGRERLTLLVEPAAD